MLIVLVVHVDTKQSKKKHFKVIPKSIFSVSLFEVTHLGRQTKRNFCIRFPAAYLTAPLITR